MGTENQMGKPLIAFPSAADLSAKKFFLGVLNASGQIALAGAGAGDFVIHANDGGSGYPCSVVPADGRLYPVRVAAAIAAGTAFTSDANGKAVAATTGGRATGIILQTASAADQEVTAWLFASGPAAAPALRVLTETHTAASFTDGGATVGTKVMTGSLPVGAIVLGTKVLVPAGFAGDTTAALTIGDGSDVDRYNTSTIDIFTTAAAGVQSGIPSGNKLLTVANTPTLTVTSSANFTSVLTAGGSVTVSIFYIQSV